MSESATGTPKQQNRVHRPLSKSRSRSLFWKSDLECLLLLWTLKPSKSFRPWTFFSSS